MTMMRKTQTLCLAVLVSTLAGAYVNAFQQSSWSNQPAFTQAQRSSRVSFVPPSSTRQLLDRRRSHVASSENGKLFSLQKLVDDVSEHSPGKAPSTIFVGGKVSGPVSLSFSFLQLTTKD